MTRSTTRYAASLTALVVPLILSLTPQNLGPHSTGISANPLPVPTIASATIGTSPGQLA